MKDRLATLFFSLVLLSLVLAASCGTAAPTAEKPQITVAIDASWPPFEFINPQSNNYEGFDIDIMNEIARLQNLSIRYVNVAFDPLLAGVRQGKYDAAISFIIITEERKKDMLFSDPYFPAGQTITVQKNNLAVKGKDTLFGKVGVIQGSISAGEIKDTKTITVYPFEDITHAFQALLRYDIDAVISDYPNALLYAGKNPDKIRVACEPFTPETYGIAVAKGKTDLLTKINAGLKEIKESGKIAQFANRWFK